MKEIKVNFYIQMKNFFKILVGLVPLIFSISSCDTREDWFEKNSEFPDIVVDINGKLDTIRRGDQRKIVVDLRTVRKQRIDFFTDTSHIIIKGVDEKGTFPMHGVGIYGLEFTGGRTFTLGDKYEVYLKLYHVFDTYHVVDSNNKDYLLFKDDSTSVILETRVGILNGMDMFGNEQSYSIEVNIHGPIPPTPVLQVSKLADNYEYKLSMEQSYDRDGRVTKHEWCIDGNVVPYYVNDRRFDDIEGGWQSGKAAYGGAYIKATELNSINHSFQTAGEHTVYYRCMDNMGIWSMWYSQKINVE